MTDDLPSRGQVQILFRRRLVIEAALLLIVAKVALLVVPFRRLAPRLGKPVSVDTPVADHDQKEIAQALAWAIERAAERLPWQSSCFARAIAGKRMLEVRRIPGMLYLGVRKDGSSQIHAHAWLKSGEVCVTGGREEPAYSPIATFSAALVGGKRETESPSL